MEDVEWIRGRDAELPGIRGPFRLAVMGRSFHWMDQERALEAGRRVLAPGGGVALVGDSNWFTRGDANWQDAVYALASEYLDDLPERTGPDVEYDDPWDELLESRGFEGVEDVTVEFEREWSADAVVGYVRSLSCCTPDAFGREERAEAFERELRGLLAARPAESFTESTEEWVIAGTTPR